MKFKIETVLVQKTDYLPSPNPYGKGTWKNYTEEEYWVYRETTNTGVLSWEKLSSWDNLNDAQKFVKSYKKTFEVEEIEL